MPRPSLERPDPTPLLRYKLSRRGLQYQHMADDIEAATGRRYTKTYLRFVAVGTMPMTTELETRIKQTYPDFG